VFGGLFEDGVELRVFHTCHADVGQEVRVEHLGELVLVQVVVARFGRGVEGQPLEECLHQLLLVDVQVVVLDQPLQVDERDFFEVDLRVSHEQIGCVVQHLVITLILQ